MAKNIATTIRLNTEIGSDMTIEFSDLKKRIKLRLIGVLHDQYLIFYLPKALLDSVGEKIFSKGVSMNIRSISRGTVFGFKAKIISVHKLNETSLFVSFPKIIQNQLIRKNHRVKCLFPAELTENSNVLSGTIADISRGGCHFQAKKALFSLDKIKSYQPGKESKIAFSLPGVETQYQLLTSIIKVAMDVEKVEISLSFLDANEAILKKIDSIIAMSFDISPL